MTASEYRAYLAANVLNEDRIITYRLLSRALKVHVNTAKEMLFEFHRQQNEKKPGTVHATYLVAGVIRKPASLTKNGSTKKDDMNDAIPSSPYRSSQITDCNEALEDSQMLSITLVREEDIQELQLRYETITSLHVYSLGSHSFRDLQALLDSRREFMEVSTCPNEEFLGALMPITNRSVRRRKGRRSPPPTSLISGPVSQKLPALGLSYADRGAMKNSTSVEKSALNNKSASKPSQISENAGSRSSQDKKNTPTQAHLKRDASNIFKSFAKSKPKLKRENTDSSTGASGPDLSKLDTEEDEIMKDISDDEEDSYIPLPEVSSKTVEIDRKLRKEREVALKKMMEDDGTDERLETISVDAVSQHVPKDDQIRQPAEEAVLEVGGSRRRGRRRVMKKRTIKDEEGYLVTKEEAAWESFSEEEIIMARPKAPYSEQPNKAPGKHGQGSIMSFFGKK